jgi:hypothetical protein
MARLFAIASVKEGAAILNNTAATDKVIISSNNVNPAVFFFIFTLGSLKR